MIIIFYGFLLDGDDIKKTDKGKNEDKGKDKDKAKGKIKQEKVKKESIVPLMNLGIVGHVDHGKTTLTQMLTGKFTDEHSEELKRGISIRLGYADMDIKKCPKCKEPLCYTTLKKCINDGSDTVHERMYSIVDLPGHETLMATVLSGASLMDGAILVIAANEECPQPQTTEHLSVLNIAKIKNIIIVQNKVDLVDEKQALKNYNQIKEFVKGSIAEDAPIIPVSAQHRANVDLLLEAIIDIMIAPKRDVKCDPKMYVARSFDVNKPSTLPKNLVGGVIGGTLVQGVLEEGDEIELRPGIKVNDKWTPVMTTITSVSQGSQRLKVGTSGGLLAVGTLLDPYLSKSDSLSGNVAGHVGKLPPVRNDLKIEVHLIERIVGLEKGQQVKQILEKDVLMMNVGTAKTVGICTAAGNVASFKLKLPVCADVGDKVALSKQINGRWRLIGYGIIQS